MDHRKYMSILKLDEAELASRRAFFALTDEDLARLASLRPLAEKITDAIVEEFYALLLSHPETTKFFADEATIRRVKRTQREYFLGLFAGRCDLAYVEDRLRVGATHERIGLAPKWYLGAYRQVPRSSSSSTSTPRSRIRRRLATAFTSVQRIVFFDVALAIDTYIAANLEALGRHQAAIRELSTPVIRVYDRVLLLPLVGAVDSHRAQQIMESVLSTSSRRRRGASSSTSPACRSSTRASPTPAQDDGRRAVARRARRSSPGSPRRSRARWCSSASTSRRCTRSAASATASSSRSAWSARSITAKGA